MHTLYMHIHRQRADDCCAYIKLFAFELARQILEVGRKSRSTTFVQRVKRNFQTAQKGVFPSLAIFAGQLKRNQLYNACGPRVNFLHGFQLYKLIGFKSSSQCTACVHKHRYTDRDNTCKYKYTHACIYTYTY